MLELNEKENLYKFIDIPGLVLDYAKQLRGEKE